MVAVVVSHLRDFHEGEGCACTGNTSAKPHDCVFYTLFTFVRFAHCSRLCVSHTSTTGLSVEEAALNFDVHGVERQFVDTIRDCLDVAGGVPHVVPGGPGCNHDGSIRTDPSWASVCVPPPPPPCFLSAHFRLDDCSLSSTVFIATV
jgi:hypothetical protein